MPYLGINKNERLNILKNQREQCLLHGLVVAISLYGTAPKYTRPALEMSQGLGSVLHVYHDSSIDVGTVNAMRSYGSTLHDLSDWNMTGDLRAMYRLLAPIEHNKVWLRDVDDYCHPILHEAMLRLFISMTADDEDTSFVVTFDPTWTHGQFVPLVAAGAVIFNNMQSNLQEVKWSAESLCRLASSYNSEMYFMSGAPGLKAQRGQTGYGCDEVFLTLSLANTPWLKRVTYDDLAGIGQRRFVQRME